MKPIRVLIVDDSRLVQSILSRILSQEPDIEVMGTADDPFEAREIIIHRKPDVITLDIEMPRMNGITFLKSIMSYRPIPVVMISSYTKKSSLQTLEALDAGAVDFVAKPFRNLKATLPELKTEIIDKIRSAAQATVNPLNIQFKSCVHKSKDVHESVVKTIAVGASTGGTLAIEKLLANISFQARGILIVQHMAEKYTKSFAERLNALFPFDIREAQDMDRVCRGKILIAPGGKHMKVVRDSRGLLVRLDSSPPRCHQRPSIDVLFHSMAKNAGKNSIGIILTGMGQDGADGLLAMRRAGAYTIAQAQNSCVVFGMPKEAIKRGGVIDTATPENIPDLILEHEKLSTP